MKKIILIKLIIAIICSYSQGIYAQGDLELLDKTHVEITGLKSVINENDDEKISEWVICKSENENKESLGEGVNKWPICGLNVAKKEIIYSGDKKTNSGTFTNLELGLLNDDGNEDYKQVTSWIISTGESGSVVETSVNQDSKESTSLIGSTKIKSVPVKKTSSNGSSGGRSSSTYILETKQKQEVVDNDNKNVGSIENIAKPIKNNLESTTINSLVTKHASDHNITFNKGEVKSLELNNQKSVIEPVSKTPIIKKVIQKVVKIPELTIEPELLTKTLDVIKPKPSTNEEDVITEPELLTKTLETSELEPLTNKEDTTVELEPLTKISETTESKGDGIKTLINNEELESCNCEQYELDNHKNEDMLLSLMANNEKLVVNSDTSISKTNQNYSAMLNADILSERKSGDNDIVYYKKQIQVLKTGYIVLFALIFALFIYIVIYINKKNITFYKK